MKVRLLVLGAAVVTSLAGVTSASGIDLVPGIEGAVKIQLFCHNGGHHCDPCIDTPDPIPDPCPPIHWPPP